VARNPRTLNSLEKSMASNLELSPQRADARLCYAAVAAFRTYQQILVRKMHAAGSSSRSLCGAHCTSEVSYLRGDLGHMIGPSTRTTLRRLMNKFSRRSDKIGFLSSRLFMNRYQRRIPEYEGRAVMRIGCSCRFYKLRLRQDRHGVDPGLACYDFAIFRISLATRLRCFTLRESYLSNRN
jgi:hypothetical protein